MPNHYTNILLCVPDVNNPDFDIDGFNTLHGDTNFCDVVRPRPKELDGIHCGHNNGMTHWRAGDVPVDVQALEAKYGAASGNEWGLKEWGTKWGTYSTKAYRLSGDSHPIVIEFLSAWGPPSIMDEIIQWLKKEFGFKSVQWIGVNPYDNSIHVLQES